MQDDAEVGKIIALLEAVKDPELPVVSIVDLGMVRRVAPDPAAGSVLVEITPTYSGCPAIKTMEEDIRRVLTSAGYKQVEVRNVYAPPWTSDWMSESGKRKLKEYGIAPPGAAADLDTGSGFVLFPKSAAVACPRCGSKNTELKSQFGSTACKALYVCSNCHQPFEYFKAL